MSDDAELLRRYAKNGSEAAFAELVGRHLTAGLIRWRCDGWAEGDAHRAQDVTQKVFIDLARKAGALSRRPVLAGWLYRSAQFAAVDLMRSEWRRRQVREREARAITDLSPDPGAAIDWTLHPALIRLWQLKEGDAGTPFLLRFAEERPFAEIGAASPRPWTLPGAWVERVE